jgi:hypothetical protein
MADILFKLEALRGLWFLPEKALTLISMDSAEIV